MYIQVWPAGELGIIWPYRVLKLASPDLIHCHRFSTK